MRTLTPVLVGALVLTKNDINRLVEGIPDVQCLKEIQTFILTNADQVKCVYLCKIYRILCPFFWLDVFVFFSQKIIRGKYDDRVAEIRSLAEK